MAGATRPRRKLGSRLGSSSTTGHAARRACRLSARGMDDGLAEQAVEHLAAPCARRRSCHLKFVPLALYCWSRLRGGTSVTEDRSVYVVPTTGDLICRWCWRYRHERRDQSKSMKSPGTVWAGSKDQAPADQVAGDGPGSVYSLISASLSLTIRQLKAADHDEVRRPCPVLWPRQEGS